MGEVVHSSTLGAHPHAGSVDEPHQGKPPASDMIRIPGGELPMGSDRHYLEEAPVHRVRVGGFWMDRTPVKTRQ
jgi:formylglycine-generating enzyme